MPRSILHIDLDAFFCAVEELLDPSLTDIPFAVGGSADERGVLATASYAARRFGVHSAMPTRVAMRLCPALKLLPARHTLYAEYSQRVMSLLADSAPVLEQISIDEAFLDVTEHPQPALELARRLQSRIQIEIGLPASFGIATNKLVAKIATNQGKPRGLVNVPPSTEAAYLAPLPIAQLWGIGPKTETKLKQLGLTTIGALAAWPEADLVRRFGEGGRQMARHARGLDDRPVQAERLTKSISQETTFTRDVTHGPVLRAKLLELSETVARQLRAEGYSARTVKLKVRWPPFETHTRQVTLAQPTHLAPAIFDAAWALLQTVWQEGQAVRLIGVGASGLELGQQLALFVEAPTERAEKLASALDAVRERHGEQALQRATTLAPRPKPPQREA